MTNAELPIYYFIGAATKSDYFFGNYFLEAVTEIRDVGVIVDDKLSFDAHCKSVVQ